MAIVLLDTNVFVHAVYRGSPLFVKAAQLVEHGLNTEGVFCIAPENLVEFAAVVTRKRFVDPPLSPQEVWEKTELLWSNKNLGKIFPGRETVRRAFMEGKTLGISGTTWYDLFLAVTMADAGVEVVVTENTKDFEKFPFIIPVGINEAFKEYEKT